MAVVGLYGFAKSGKDTVAQIIQKYDRKWEIKKFSYKLKQIASILTGIPEDEFESQEIKESFLPSWWNKMYVDGYGVQEHRLQVRELLQILGTDAIRNNVHEDAWVNALFADYNPAEITEWKPSNWIITDVRFPNEYESIKEMGGIVIKINREGIKPINTHISEIALWNTQFDHTIENNGTLDDLEKYIKKYILHFLI